MKGHVTHSWELRTVLRRLVHPAALILKFQCSKCSKEMYKEIPYEKDRD